VCYLPIIFLNFTSQKLPIHMQNNFRKTHAKWYPNGFLTQRRYGPPPIRSSQFALTLLAARLRYCKHRCLNVFRLILSRSSKKLSGRVRSKRPRVSSSPGSRDSGGDCIVPLSARCWHLDLLAKSSFPAGSGSSRSDTSVRSYLAFADDLVRQHSCVAGAS